jgi:hypothetical protein
MENVFLPFAFCLLLSAYCFLPSAVLTDSFFAKLAQTYCEQKRIEDH